MTDPSLSLALVIWLAAIALVLVAYEVYWVFSLRRTLQRELRTALGGFDESQAAALKEVYRQLHWVADAVTQPPPKAVKPAYDYSTTLRPMSARLDMRIPRGLPDRPADPWVSDQATQPIGVSGDTEQMPVFQRQPRLVA